MSDASLDFSLHPGQLDIFQDPRRFKVVAAGRRFGKTYLSCVQLLIEGLKMHNEQGYPLENQSVYYVAPTFQQGKEIMWRLIKNLGAPVIDKAYEKEAVVKLINGRTIHIKGSDKPDSLRGVGLSYVVLDEFATMKPETWDEILLPTLADVQGGALFIGTPAGKNHFYELFCAAKEDPLDWATFEFKSIDNPFLEKAEIERAKRKLASDTFRQEFEASFSSGGGAIFKAEWMNQLTEEPQDGEFYMTVDPAGYEAVTAKKLSAHKSRLDEMAICVVKVGTHGWWVADIITGRWDVREASIRILRTAQKYHPMCIGIEKGSLKQAIMPYLEDQMRRLNTYPAIREVTHGNKKKEERITWALQGRMEHGRISFNRDKKEMVDKFRVQALDFPSPLTHDDMLDALAYIDQIAVTSYIDEPYIDTWEAQDWDAGY